MTSVASMANCRHIIVVTNPTQSLRSCWWPPKTGFDPRPACVRSVVDKVAFEQVFLRVRRLFLLVSFYRSSIPIFYWSNTEAVWSLHLMASLNKTLPPFSSDILSVRCWGHWTKRVTTKINRTNEEQQVIRGWTGEATSVRNGRRRK